MTLWLEVFFVSFIQDGVTYYRKVVGMGDETRNPDEVVNKLVMAELDVTPNILKDDYVVHSSGWRYERANDIYLTYLVIADEVDFGSHETKNLFVGEMSYAESENTKNPRPKVIEEKHVLCHGLVSLSCEMEKSASRYEGALNNKSLSFVKSLKAKVCGTV